ncbi:MAG TPA: LpqB family beta-propeller domain-containing protein [Kribbella sp.]
MKRVLVLLALAGLLAGCATVPTSGPIRQGSQGGLNGSSQGVVVEAQKPRQNADQLPIVNGFLEAMSDSRAFDVAREYMTPDAAARWKPEQMISVYDQTSTTAVSRDANQNIRLDAPLIGTIDQRGSWTPAKSKNIHFVFKLKKVSGQWRIANFPNGVFLGRNQLETNMAPRNLYFLSPTREMLVPDPVFMPITLPAGQAATQLVQELLKGPTGRLGNGVTSAAPPGTQVNVSVPIEDSVATVALSDAASALGDADRRLLAAQIAWTLRPITTRVRITVNGAPLIDGEPGEQSFSNFNHFDPAAPNGQLKQLYVVQNGKVRQLLGLDGSQEINTLPLDGSLLYGYAAQSFAVSLQGDYGAVVTRCGGDCKRCERDSLCVAYARLTPKDKGEKLVEIQTEGTVLRPSFDWQGNLWIVDRANNARPRLRVRTVDGKVTQVVTDFQGADPTVFRIAPDGVRALMVVKRGSATSVQTGTIATDDKKAMALSRIRPLQLPLTDISDASWYRPDEIMVTGASGAGPNRQPWEVNVDGSQPRLVVGAGEWDAVALAASPNLEALTVIRDGNGLLHWQSKDLSWFTLQESDTPRNSQPVYPG